MEGCGEWTRHANIGVPLKFNTAIMFSIANMCMQFISTLLALTHNASDFISYQAVMLYSIF